MNAKEILELVEESYTSEDIAYKNKVYLISYFLSSIIFVLIHISIKYWNFNILYIISLLIIVGGMLIIRQKNIYKKHHF
ncbi:hypothetical protein JH146_1346 [Methanocaldococcus bathoardescens]|uniref:Uncharacterized protein n=1 Tax=Methanocaldococcus bathoardescens TaxID=1301915 RepID=A0A076LI66_9EURY|nr:hypothetical protein [Methanocaldococcus bathoardescens]AIJ06188.1 hypothetical protein JH146_1346 [Methanocaldococcus bathoardescens]